MASQEFDDPEEYVGATHGTKADPKGGKRAAQAPRVAVYNPPAKGDAHPKIARLAPAQRLDAADAALNQANAELQAATNHLRSCELIEAEAEAALMKELPGPTQAEVHREMLAKEAAAKVERVAQGLPAVEPKQVTARSPIDVLAAQRPRQAPGISGSLRSPVARRNV